MISESEYFFIKSKYLNQTRSSEYKIYLHSNFIYNLNGAPFFDMWIERIVMVTLKLMLISALITLKHLFGRAN